MVKHGQQFIEQLGLDPHPEGGHFKELFRSSNQVQPQDNRSKRNSLTIIYFLLQKGEISKWHRVKSDEAWHFLEGDPLRLYLMDEQKQETEQKTLGPVDKTQNAVEVVPANVWQAAECIGDYSLVSCSVGPGFDFDDFEMLSDQKKGLEKIKRICPDFIHLI